MKSPTSAPPVFLLAREVADLLRCDVRTVHRWRNRGLLPTPLRIGRSLRWNRDEILRLISRRN